MKSWAYESEIPFSYLGRPPGLMEAYIISVFLCIIDVYKKKKNEVTIVLANNGFKWCIHLWGLFVLQIIPAKFSHQSQLAGLCTDNRISRLPFAA